MNCSGLSSSGRTFTGLKISIVNQRKMVRGFEELIFYSRRKMNPQVILPSNFEWKQLWPVELKETFKDPLALWIQTPATVASDKMGYLD